MNARRLRLAFVPIFCLAVIISESYWSYSCIPWNPEPTRISYVDPALLSDSIYRSYYRSILEPSQVRYDDWVLGEESTPADPNIREWQSYFDGKIPARPLLDLVYRAGRMPLDTVLADLQAGRQSDIPDMIVLVDDWARKQYPELEGQALIDYLRANDRAYALDTLMYGTALREVARRRDIPFLEYMIFAKECEPLVTDDAWDRKSKDTASFNRLQARGKQLYDACSSAYLKLRYAYQLVRLAHYSGEFRKAIDQYDNLVQTNSARSILRYWALGHKAGAVKRMGDLARANYLFSLAFDSSESRRNIALLDFVDKGDGPLWDSTMAFAQDNYQRATLWMMRGLRERRLALTPLKKMYELTPGSPRTAAMMLRELHRIERYLYSDKATRSYAVQQKGGFPAGRWDKEQEKYIDTGITNKEDSWGPVRRSIAPGESWDTLAYYKQDSVLVEVLSGRDYVLAFRRFAKDVALQGLVPEPALWYMAAGYIDLMDNDYTQADDCLSEAMRDTRGNTDLEHQIRLLDYLARVKQSREIGSDLSGHITETLRWIREQQKTHRHSKYDRTMVTLGREYLRTGDVPRAILAFDLGKDHESRNTLLDIYSTEEDLKTLDGMLTGNVSTELDRMLTRDFSLGRDALFDVRGSRLMRAGKFTEALAMFEQTGSRYWNEPTDALKSWRDVIWRRFWSSPDTTRHTGSSLVPTDWYYGVVQTDSIGRTIPGARLYTRLSFAQEVVNNLRRAEQDPAQADSAYFRIGNMLFNSPFWGYPDAAWDGTMSYTLRGLQYGSTNWPFNFEGIQPRIDTTVEHYIARYGSRKQARDFYTKVMEITDNRELAAHCAYLLDLCAKRPQTTLQTLYNADNQDRTGFDLLMTKYRDTRYSQSILSQCSTYKYFLAQK